MKMEEEELCACILVQSLGYYTMALQAHMHVFVCYVPHGPFTNIEADYV